MTIPWVDRPTLLATYTGVWPDAAHLDGALLDVLLEAATDQCAAYAPTLPADATRPAGWALAVVWQTRELWEASKRAGLDVIDVSASGIVIRTRPLTGPVKAALRPDPAIPGLG